MPEETQNTFEDIKPFIRMLEGSINEARAKRIAQEGREANNGNPNTGPSSSSPSTNVPSQRHDGFSNSSGNQTARPLNRDGGLASNSPSASIVGQTHSNQTNGFATGSNSLPNTTAATPNYRI